MPSIWEKVAPYIVIAMVVLFILFIVFLWLYLSAKNPSSGGARPLSLPQIPSTAVDGAGTVTAHPFSRIVHMVQIPWERTPR